MIFDGFDKRNLKLKLIDKYEKYKGVFKWKYIKSDCS